MRRLVCEYYDGFSFGRFVKKYPHFKGHLTDLLIGDLFKDEVDEVVEPMNDIRRGNEAAGRSRSHGGANRAMTSQEFTRLLVELAVLLVCAVHHVAAESALASACRFLRFANRRPQAQAAGRATSITILNHTG